MARNSSVISVLITGDAGPLKKAIGSAGSALSSFGKMAIAGLAAAAGATVAFTASLIKAAEEGQVVEQRIRNITESMGLFGSEAGKVSDRLLKVADALSLQTGVSDDLIAETQGILLTFKNVAKSADEVGGIFDRANKAALDLAAAGFGEATSNAVQLGKALQDPVKGLTALSRSGVTFTAEEKERIKTLVASNKVGEAQLLILSAIEQQVGGTAEATATASAKMRVAFDQAKERLGTALLPAFGALAAFIAEKVVPAIETYLLPAVDRIGQFLAGLAPHLERFGGFFTETIEPALRNLSELFTTSVLPALQRFGAFMQDTILPAVVSFAEWAQANLIPVLAEIGRFFGAVVLPAVQSLVAFVVTYLVPIFKSVLGPVLQAVSGFLADVRDRLGENSGQFAMFFERIKPVAEFVRDVLAPVIGVVLARAFTVIAEVVGGTITVFVTLLDIIGRVIDKVIEFTRRVADSQIGSALGAIIAKIPGRAFGGPVGVGKPYIVGERGPELFVPTGSGRIEPGGGGGGGIVINVSGAIDPEGTARTIVRVLEDAQRRSGLRLAL